MTNERAPRRARRLRLLVVSTTALLAVLFVSADVAMAHTSFVSSSPSGGQTLAEPVDSITIEFSGVSEPADDGFTVLLPDGQLRTPTSIVTADQKVFTLTFDPPLAGGTVGVRWSVSAPDAHPIGGAFSFSVTAPATGGVEAAGGATAAAATATDANGVEQAGTATVPDAGATDTMVMSDTAGMSAGMSMDEFMAVQPASAGKGTARLGRIVEFAALALLIGGAAFAATTLRGRGEEIDRAIGALRALGLMLAAGAALEYIGVARIAQAPIVDYWSSSPGLATVLRGAGGMAIAAGLVAVTVPVRAPRPARPLSAAVNPAVEYEREDVAGFWHDDERRVRDHRPIRPELVQMESTPARAASTIDPLLGPHQHHHRTVESSQIGSVLPADRPVLTISTAPPPRTAHRVDARHAPEARPIRDSVTEAPVIRRWDANRASAFAYVGIGVAIISFWFDGHTVSKSPRPLHAVVNSVHVVAGSVWVGGVVAMTAVLWSRHRAGIPPRALEMVVRFSGVATISLAAVLAAGGVMAFVVLDSIGELFSTEWGKVLLLKTAAVGLALIGGAYNHFQLLPGLEADPDDPQLIERLRSVVTSEAILLGFVIVVTASLVSAAS